MFWQARDPIPQFRKFALDAGLMNEADLKDIEKEVLAEVEDAVKFADESPKPVSSFAHHHIDFNSFLHLTKMSSTLWYCL